MRRNAGKTMLRYPAMTKCWLAWRCAAHASSADNSGDGTRITTTGLFTARGFLCWALRTETEASSSLQFPVFLRATFLLLDMPAAAGRGHVFIFA